MPTSTKPLTVGELFGALSGVPLHTPVTIVASINASIDEADTERGYVDYEGRLNAIAVVRHLNEVTIEAVEPCATHPTKTSPVSKQLARN